MKTCPPSLAVKEMQIKTTLRSHFTPVRRIIIKNTNNNKYWQRCGGSAYKEVLYNTVDRNIN
jgi:hypothetical protein